MENYENLLKFIKSYFTKWGTLGEICSTKGPFLNIFPPKGPFGKIFYKLWGLLEHIFQKGTFLLRNAPIKVQKTLKNKQHFEEGFGSNPPGAKSG